MTLADYPFLDSSEADAIAEVVRRIIDLRQDDLVQLNELLRTEGYSKGILRETVSTATNYILGAETFYLDVDASGGDRTITLNATPVDGEAHIVANNSGTNNVILDGNGKNINGSGTLSYNTQYQARYVVYMGGAGEWRALTL